MTIAKNAYPLEEVHISRDKLTFPSNSCNVDKQSYYFKMEEAEKTLL